MKLFSKKEILGFIAAPLIAPLSFSFSVSFADIGKYDNFLEAILIIMLIGTPISYLVTIFIGIPLYLLFKRLNYVGLISLSLGGLLCVSIALLLMIGGSITDIQEKDITFYGPFLISGFFVGMFFSLIINGKRL